MYKTGGPRCWRTLFHRRRKRTESKLQSLEKMLEKAPIVDVAQNHKRGEDINMLEDKLDTRVAARLGYVQKHQREPGGSTASVWRPTHMILGYEGNLSRDEVVAWSRAFLEGIGNDKGLCLDPYPLQKSGQICTIRLKDGSLTQVVWAARKKLEAGTGPKGRKLAT